MTAAEIHDRLRDKFGEKIGALNEESLPASIEVSAEAVESVCTYLYQTEGLYFDQLSCLTGLDNGPEMGSLEVIYNLYSIAYQHALMLRVVLPRNAQDEPLPAVPSVSHIWRTADWHEREAFDMVGIRFTGHPDMRRILLPADWEGYPLRKDYQEQAYYHGIQVPHVDDPRLANSDDEK